MNEPMKRDSEDQEWMNAPMGKPKEAEGVEWTESLKEIKSNILYRHKVSPNNFEAYLNDCFENIRSILTRPQLQTGENILARNQPCGCVVCSCEDEVQCHGCGASNCGTKECVFKYHPENKVYTAVQKAGRHK